MRTTPRKPLILLLLLFLATLGNLPAPPPGFNYDEAAVPKYTLPDPLRTVSGMRVTRVKTWQEQRRPEILRLFETQVYGIAPGPGPAPEVTEISRDENALGGKATRREIRLRFPGPPELHWYLLLYLPNDVPAPAPAFLGLNFWGNHSIHPDPAIRLSTAWMRKSPKGPGVVNHRATHMARGTKLSQWPAETIVDRGYALATIYYGDIDPDFDDGFKNGIHGVTPGFDRPKLTPDQWGSISAWAWGLSRIMDYLEIEAAVDEKRVALLGHSRLGKTSLWAGARDERFAIVISNNSGCGGAALSRRAFGETVARINTSFPHWFCDNFTAYNDNENALPVDQHMLISLIAPRPVYVASAVEDQWADPRGEFLSARHAEPVYKLLGKKGLGVRDLPPVDEPVGEFIRYHVRSGKHDVTEFDWAQYLDFADRHFGSAHENE